MWIRPAADAFSADDQEMLETLAVEAARVIQNTWLFEQSRLRARQLATLVNVSQTINSSLNLDDALQAITREACLLARRGCVRCCSWTNRGSGSICAPATERARPT